MIGVIKRFVLAVIAIAVVLGGVGFYLLQRGVWGLDDWVARQVVAITEAYIVPRISFTTFTYTAPGTIEFVDVVLTSPGGVEVVKADTLRVSLAETPRLNRPIVIKQIAMTNPVLRLIHVEHPQGAGEVMFEGLVPFVRADNVRKQDQVDENVRLSTILRIRELSLLDGVIEYHDGSDQPPMRLTDINMDLKLDPDATGADPGWYRVTSELKREPIFDLDIDARINLDTLSAELNPLRLRIDLGEDTYGSLPPQLQAVLREYEVVGKLEAHLTGAVDGRDPLASRLEAGAWIDELDFAAGEYRVPINEGRFEATLSERTLNFSRAYIELLRGSISLTRAHMAMSGETWPAEINWEAKNLRIQDLLRTATPEGELPALAGRVASTGSATLDGRTGLGALAGAGELNLTEGRLINLPFVQGLLNILKVTSALAGEGGMTDKAFAKFDLTPTGVQVTTLDLRSQVIAARGKGVIGFDSTVDAELNAGPLEKMQNMLGPIGEAIGAVTDNLVKYHVTGKLGDVKVSVKPLGVR